MTVAIRLDQIQGNVLPGFGGNHQTLLALRIDDASAARGWIGRLADEVATATQVIDSRRPPDGAWVNVAFSHEGLRILTGGDPGFRDEAFRAGLSSRAGILGDPGSPDDWVVGGPGNPLHILVVVAGGDDSSVAGKVSELATAAARSGLTEVWQENGTRLHDLDGRAIEHFGFRDDVSQPAVRGLPSTHRDRTVVTPTSPDGPEYSAPGAPLIWPGSFVFGYPAQSPNDPVREGFPADGGPAWATDGSYLVFRRLRQNYEGFWNFLAAEAGQIGMAAEALGALVVGRWKSGAPVVRTAHGGPAGPGRDDPELGRDRFRSNDFEFGDADGADNDPLGLACPASAHIRKVNPRAGYTDQGGQEDTLTRRILRRGIPFGPLYPDAPDEERGLHFLCYQTSITHQFEFLSRTWSNSPAAPRDGGTDLLVGQVPQPRPRTAFLQRPGGASATIPVSAGLPFVYPTGGEYLFAPSIDGLRHIAAG